MNNKAFYKGRVVVITGSSKGIGKAIALKIGQYGAKVVLNGRSSEALLSTEEELKRAGINCLTVQADVSLIEGAKKLIEEAVIGFGKIDVVINNSGIAVHGLFTETEPTTWQKVIQSNTLSSIYTTYFAIPYLKSTHGSIVFISSIGGRAGLPGHGAYSFSKMPLTSLTQTLDVELHEDQIHVGIVYVGFTRNDPNKTITDGTGKTKRLQPRNMNLLMEPEKVAEAVANLIRKRKKKKVLTLIGHAQTFFYQFPLIRRLIMKSMLKKYYNMYAD
ncbi:MAG: SDR family NAD(P)-dependent oxidoreductase [Prolixibacteraceae bacterium]|nr:SDR family NAD(P)-dependent oxidoreductase [Prolixibacteraceae bacterium]